MNYRSIYLYSFALPYSFCALYLCVNRCTSGWFFTSQNRLVCMCVCVFMWRMGAMVVFIVFFYVDAITQMSFLDIFFCFWLKAKCFKRHTLTHAPFLFQFSCICMICRTIGTMFHWTNVNGMRFARHELEEGGGAQLRMGLNDIYYTYCVCVVQCNKLKTVTVLCSVRLLSLISDSA